MLENIKVNIIVIAVFVVILLLLFSPVLFGNKILLPTDQLNTTILPYSYGKTIDVYNHFLNDAILQYYNYKNLTKNALSQGRLFYWNPLVLGGFPQYSLIMAGNFDVTNFTLLLFDMPRAFLFQSLVLLLIAGIAMFSLLRYFKNSVMVSLIVAVCYMCNSMFITTLFHRWIIASFCWMPFVILYFDKSLSENKISDYALCGIFLGVALLPTFVQTAAFILILLLSYALGFWRVNREKGINLGQSLKIFWIVLILGVGLSAVMWFPTTQHLYYDLIKSGGNISAGDPGSSILQRLAAIPLTLSFIMPELGGSVRSFDLTKFAGSTLTHFNGYIGFLPFIFACWAVVQKEKHSDTQLFLIIAITPLVILIGTFLLKFLYYRFLIVYIFGVCLLAASGLTSYIKSTRKEKIMPFIEIVTKIFFCLVAVISIGNLIMFLFHDKLFMFMQEFISNRMYMANLSWGMQDWYLSRIANVFTHFNIFSPTMCGPILTIGLGIGLIRLYVKEIISSHKFLVFCLIITAIQLVSFSRSWLPMIDKEKYPAYPLTDSVMFLKQDRDIFRVVADSSDKSKQLIYPSNTLSIYGIESVYGYESVWPEAIKSIVAGSGHNAYTLGLCNVKYLITYAGTELNSDFNLVYPAKDGIEIYENKRFIPRAFMRYKYNVMPGKEILEGLRHNKLDAHEYVFFDREPGQKVVNKHRFVEYNLKITRYEDERISLNVNTPERGYSVVSNTYYPGWRCYIDREPADLMKANYVMWAVLVPNGSHVVEFIFRPGVFYAGVFVSLVFLLIILAMFIVERRRFRNETAVS